MMVIPNDSITTGINIAEINFDNKLHHLLTSTSCGELVAQAVVARDRDRPQIPICFDGELTVEEGCRALAANKISSAPVYSQTEGGFVGMLSYEDLVTYVLEVFHKVPKSTTSFDINMEVTDIVKRSMSDRQGIPIHLVSNLSQRNPLVAIFHDSPLLHAIEEFVLAKVHRLVVLERPDASIVPPPAAKFIGVLSQSTVVDWMVTKFGTIAQSHMGDKQAAASWDIAKKSVAELGLVRGEIFSVGPNDLVLDSLTTMNQKNVSSVAIVEEGSYRLVGSISMSDIKEILSHRGGWRRLYEPAFKFFTSLRNVQGIEEGGNDRVPLFSVKPTTSLISTMEKLAATRSHRVWVTDTDGNAVGVVTTFDVMSVVGRSSQSF